MTGFVPILGKKSQHSVTLHTLGTEAAVGSEKSNASRKSNKTLMEVSLITLTSLLKALRNIGRYAEATD